MFSTGGSTREESAFKFTQVISLQLCDLATLSSQRLPAVSRLIVPSGGRSQYGYLSLQGLQGDLFLSSTEIKSYIREPNLGGDSLSLLTYSVS